MEYVVIALLLRRAPGRSAPWPADACATSRTTTSAESRFGYWVVAFSARASGESAWLYLGLTGLGALVGAYAHSGWWWARWWVSPWRGS